MKYILKIVCIERNVFEIILENKEELDLYIERLDDNVEDYIIINRKIGNAIMKGINKKNIIYFNVREENE